MNDDLRDLLAAWHGAELEPARRAELLAKLREDETLRTQLASELTLLGQIKAAVSPEPRWLALEDLLRNEAASEAEEPEDDFANRVMRNLPKRRAWPAALRWAGALAALVAILVTTNRWLLSKPKATLVGAGVRVERGGQVLAFSAPIPLQVGDLIQSGSNTTARITFTEPNAAAVLEADASMHLASMRPTSIALQRGRLGASVAPRPAHNPFSVLTSDALVDGAGAQFLVSSQRDATWVSVQEGGVTVRSLHDPGEVRLGPGQFTLAAAGFPLVAREVGPGGLAVPLETEPGSMGGDGDWEIRDGIYRQKKVSHRPEPPFHTEGPDNPGSWVHWLVHAPGNVRATVRVSLDSLGTLPLGAEQPWGFSLGLSAPSRGEFKGHVAFKLAVGPAPVNGMDASAGSGGLHLIGSYFGAGGDSLPQEFFVPLTGTAFVPYDFKAGEVCWLQMEAARLSRNELGLRGKVWREGEEEPASWMVDARAEVEPLTFAADLVTRRAACTFDHWRLEWIE